MNPPNLIEDKVEDSDTLLNTTLASPLWFIPRRRRFWCTTRTACTPEPTTTPEPSKAVWLELTGLRVPFLDAQGRR